MTRIKLKNIIYLLCACFMLVQANLVLANEVEIINDIEPAIQAEQQVKEIIAKNNLLFKSHLIDIYQANNFLPIWDDSELRETFLQQYTLFALSGISKKSFEQYQQFLNYYNMNSDLQQDILLSDLFLDYLYFTNNLKKSASVWLYGTNLYTPKAPTKKAINNWLASIKQNNAQQFIETLQPSSKYYIEQENNIYDFIKTAEYNAENSNKIKLLSLNLQRLRLLPLENFTNGILVNIPEYHLYFYRDGELMLESKVVVGKRATKTPNMRSKLSSLVVNPPWKPTNRIMRETLLPQIKKDPSYAYRAGYQILDHKRQVVDPYTIDWENIDLKKFPYLLQQVPQNSTLGRFKFNMPSSNYIYLHDTPSKGAFEKNIRTISQGCVRVEAADKLAAILLAELGWSDEKQQEILDENETVIVPLESDNPVYIYYITAWFENSELKIVPDVYKYDSTLSIAGINGEKLNQILN